MTVLGRVIAALAILSVAAPAFAEDAKPAAPAARSSGRATCNTASGCCAGARSRRCGSRTCDRCARG